MIYILWHIPDCLRSSEVSVVLLEVSNPQPHGPSSLQEKLSWWFGKPEIIEKLNNNMELRGN